MSRCDSRSLCAAVFLFGASTAANAQLTYYTNFATFQQATTTAVVEDFENAAQLQVPLSSFSHNGNIYTGMAGRNLSNQPFPNVYLAAAGADNFGTPPILSTVLTANGDEDFTVTLGTPNSVVGFNAYTNTFGPAVIQVFGGGGLLGTFSLAQDPTMVGFFGVVASQPIASFRWTTTNGAQVNTGIDNLRVGIVTAVPEPSIIAMLCTGILTGAIGMRRRFSSGASARPALA